MTNQEKMRIERDILTKNLSFELMGKRTGNLDKEHKPINTIEGVNEMSKQLNYHGGYFQQNREIKDKRKSLDKALLYSYQGAFVKKYGSADIVRALINPNRLKQDYDDKIISIGFEHEFHTGDIFEWVDTNTHWLIYLQEQTEIAYFRGEIRKCRYQISWKDGDKLKSTFAAVRGPVETKIDYTQKHGIHIDTPNGSLHILMPLNEDTLKQFKRYSKFYLSNIENEDRKICWRVEATDSISTPGILELTAVEYYSNEFEDDIENGIAGGLIEEVKPNPDAIEELIVGETFIKPKTANIYTFTGEEEAEWVIEGKYAPVIINKIDQHSIELIWNANTSGQFVLCYGDYKKTIVVESLF